MHPTTLSFQVMHYLGQYIIVKELYDKQRQHIVHCQDDPLGELLEVESFSVKSPRSVNAFCNLMNSMSSNQDNNYNNYSLSWSVWFRFPYAATIWQHEYHVMYIFYLFIVISCCWIPYEPFFSKTKICPLSYYRETRKPLLEKFITAASPLTVTKHEHFIWTLLLPLLSVLLLIEN